MRSRFMVLELQLDGLMQPFQYCLRNVETNRPYQNMFNSAMHFLRLLAKLEILTLFMKSYEKYPSSIQRDSIIGNLKKIRKVKLKRAKTIAVPLKNTDVATLLDELGVTEKELQKRYDKIVSRWISIIESTFPAVLSNPLARKELHDIRITCKKLRYMLEILPDENTPAVQIGGYLRKIQDSLGAIHDSDFTVSYLQSLPQSSKVIQEIIGKENELRKQQFKRFLNYSKRRLGISPDSFLCKIGIFKLAN